MLSLKKLEAAIVFPIVSLSFVVSALMAVVLFKEKLTPNRVAASLLSILAGWLLSV
jgi:drug/metabolite transporter (DMT)-like permease